MALRWLVFFLVLLPLRVSPAQTAAGFSRGTLSVRSLYSPALGVRKRYQVYLPASYLRESRRRYPVAYLLHGRTGNEADWTARGDLDAIADSLFAAPAGAPGLILIMPDGDNSFWVNWDSWPGFAACARDTLLAEAAPSFCVNRAGYGDYVAHDLVAEVDAAFRTVPERAHRGLMGLSMGGTGALTLALTYPDVFGATAAFSAPHPIERAAGRPVGPLTQARWGADTSSWWRHSPDRAARRLRGAGKSFPAIRIEIGRADMYLEENRAFAATLRGLGVEHEYLEGDGGHEWSYWRPRIAATLAWLARRIN